MPSRLAWLLSSRELRWRRRRFVIAAAGTSLAFALTLLLSGFRDGADLEIAGTIRQLGADGFVVKEGVHGPFTTTAQLPAGLARDLARRPGVERADPIVSVRHTIESHPEADVYVIGARPGGLGTPAPVKGRAPRRRGEAVLDVLGGRRVGDRFVLGGMPFEVVGLVRHASVWGGVADAFVVLEDAQALLLDGRDGATAILTRGLPRSLPPGVRLLDRAGAAEDLERPVANAFRSIELFRTLVWVVAAAIVGSLLYVSALERGRDFAVCKAFGARSADLVAALAIQAVALAVLSAAAGMGVARLLLPAFPAVISLRAATLGLLPVVAVAVGLAGTVAGARRALSADPAAAFDGP